jgi:hypothetical protein
MIPAAQVVEQVASAGLGFDRVELIAGDSYHDASTVVIVPTRGVIHHRWVERFMGLMAPMNQKRHVMFVSGHEVGRAYDAALAAVLANPELSKWRYVLTVEDDNLVPPNAHLLLLETLRQTGADAASGLYFTKGEHNMPMAYGDPASREFDFKPRDVRAALAAGQVMPVNGIAMGCALWRMDLFRRVPAPWFVTVQEWDEVKGGRSYTQDLSFCEKAVRQFGARFVVDMRVRVGHLDVSSGEVY